MEASGYWKLLQLWKWQCCTLRLVHSRERYLSQGGNDEESRKKEMIKRNQLQADTAAYSSWYRSPNGFATGIICPSLDLCILLIKKGISIGSPLPLTLFITLFCVLIILPLVIITSI